MGCLFESPLPLLALLLIVLTGVWSTAYLNKAMSLFPNNIVVPIYYCTFTLASVSAGALVYHEFDCMDVKRGLLFLLGCFFTFGGVFIVSGAHKQDGSHKKKARDGQRRHIELLDEVFDEGL
jgi:hypothetical protein